MDNLYIHTYIYGREAEWGGGVRGWCFVQTIIHRMQESRKNPHFVFMISKRNSQPKTTREKTHLRFVLQLRLSQA